MDRLVDYFAVVGYDHEAEDNVGVMRGKVVTRIPEQDWDDAPFIQGIHLFCQPTGWFLSKEKYPPKYFVAVLTDAEGKRHYCAILAFSEPIQEENSSSPDPRFDHLSRRDSSKRIRAGNIEEVDESLCEVDIGQELKTGEGLETVEGAGKSGRDEYMPKCLVLIARHPEFTVFKNCLGLIYTIYIEGLSVSLETVIANLLVVNIPPHGAPVMRFSIGAADRQALQTPECEEVPVTRSSVSTLLRHLGILNVMNVLTAALVDHKLLFYSCSYSRLSDSCNALTALMFPFSYSYPYIPILPINLLECTSSPTPFLIGVHSSLRSELHDLVDVIAVDLDGGVISVPECISIPHIPEPYYTQAVELLTKVLCPDLAVADHAYPPEVINTSDPEKLDKEIRAIFLRLFCQLLTGYRSCLQVCRIHPRPIIRFQKESFLTLRGYDKIQLGSSADFMPKLVESQAFSLFIQDQGPPYRRLDMFDREVAVISETMKKEGGEINKALQHMKELSFELYRNENPSSSPPIQKVPKPSEGSFLRPRQLKFPKLSPTAVQTFMVDKVNKNKPKNANPIKRPSMLVPDGPSMDFFTPRMNLLTSSSRRLDVLRSCVQFIFENRSLETKKIFHAVLRTLKNRTVRSALTQELNSYAKLKPCLDNQQFEYIARLCNSALDDCSGEDDEFSIAADLLQTLSTFYRKLCPTVMQFLYTVVQEHPVWVTIEFWDFMFFRDVQSEMCRLYQRSQKRSNRENLTEKSAVDLNDKADSLKHVPDSDSINSKCLEIAAEELRDVLFKSEKEKKELAGAEEGVIMGQIQHTAQIMIFMLVPLSDGEGVSNVKFLNNPFALNEDGSNSYFTSSLAGSIKGESIDEDDDDSYQGGLDVKGIVAKFVSMFVDRACSETGISAEYSKALLAKVSGLVLMQHESLQDVARESRSLPPIKKVKLLQPKMLPGELLLGNHTLRAYLAYDGRLSSTGDELGGPTLLPAEGAVFVSNYRVMFIGIPCDTLASEQVVIRSFPLSGLFKVKLFSDHDRAKDQKMDASIQHWGLLYSSSFQLLLLGFDEDISEEQRNAFEQKINALRNPSTIDDVFAISQQTSRYARLHSITSDKNLKSDKSGSLEEGISHSKHGTKSLMKQAKKKAGMTLGKQQRLTNLMMADAKVVSIYSSALVNDHGTVESHTKSQLVDEIVKRLLSDKGTQEQLYNLACYYDFKRLKLIESNNFRISSMNNSFSLCRSYPVFAVVPKTVLDENLKSVSLCHQLNRFPSIVWMHPKSKALLLRASALKSRTTAAISKHSQSSQSYEGTAASSMEVERFLLEVIECSRNAKQKKTTGSTSTLQNKNENGRVNNDQPKSPRQKRNNGIAGSSREAKPESILSLKGAKKWGTLTRVMGRPAAELFNPTLKSAIRTPAIKSSNDTLRSNSATLTPHPAVLDRHAELYVLGDKNQIKTMKPQLQGRVNFVFVTIPEPKQVRNSFKNALKVCLPLDTPPPTHSAQASASVEDNQLFRKAFEGTGWLQMVSSLLCSACAIVEMIDVQESSVMLAMEMGWDATPQLTSLVQIMLDPNYRTLTGFQTLLQKEWFSFGHRFSHRNHFNDVISTGFTPIFLQFLDCVYQILNQFPLAFEFNQIFLETLAYHCTSSRFKTFILDSDYERLEAGILLERKKLQPSHEEKKSSSNGKFSKGDSHQPISSVWQYITRAQERSQVFLNTLRLPTQMMQTVLHPVTSVCRFRVWSFFIREALADCPIYDGLLGEFLSTNSSPNEQETPEAGEGWKIQSGRRVVNPSYDNIFEVQPDALRSLIQQIEHLNVELGKPPQSGLEIWVSAIKSTPIEQKKLPFSVHIARKEAKLMHARLSSAITARSASQENLSEAMLFSNVFDTLRPGSLDMFNPTSLYQLQTQSSEVCTYQGTLWKQGAYMKSWRQRFFVLDSTKHQLRQYESQFDQTFKSSFDMKEVEDVRLIDFLSGAPKGVQQNSFFELKTSKRVYHFIAESNEDAKKWIEALQNALEA